MIFVTFIIKFIIITSASADVQDIERRINLTLQTKKNVSETALLVDLKTFVHDNGIKRNGNKSDLRMSPRYYLPSQDPKRELILDLMRQLVYTTQERMQALDPILKKYEHDPALRMAFIYNRLRQIIIDMRRIYTMSFVMRNQKRVYEQIYWYSHVTRKYFDVLYIVEHVLDLFQDYIKKVDSKRN